MLTERKRLCSVVSVSETNNVKTDSIMKTYTVNVTARGGLWRGQRRKYAIIVKANTKPEARAKALDVAEKELKGEEDYDSIHAGTTKLAKHLENS